MKGRVDYTKVPGYKPPEERRCQRCYEEMRPVVDWEDLPDDAEGENVVKRYNRKCRPVRIVYYGYGPEEMFCSLTCGYVFACQVVKAQLGQTSELKPQE